MPNPTGYSRPDPNESEPDFGTSTPASTAAGELAAYSEDTIDPILKELDTAIQELEKELDVNKKEEDTHEQ